METTSDSTENSADESAETRTDVIVVGAADTATANRAVQRAGEMAKALNARLIVVTAHSDSSVDVVGVGSDTFIISPASEAAAFAERTAALARITYGVDASGVAGEGKPEDVILSVAERLGATMIVVGNVRMQGAGRLLGSVANDIAHHAPCDVYVVKTA